jgi:hypothetical protein
MRKKWMAREVLAGQRGSCHLLPVMSLFKTAGLLGALLLGGCALPKTTPAKTDQFQVSVPKAQFYKYGPSQSFGPDFVLVKGQRVTVTKRSFGFTRVVTQDGVTGYVASEELEPAPPDPVPVATPPPQLARRGSKARDGVVEPTSELPLFDVNDVPSALPDSGPPKPAPGFRY